MAHKLAFDKIHACGNDFILLAQPPNAEWIGPLCDRYHGLGADGIMVWHESSNRSLTLDHFDPDGTRSFCLNGIRATLACLHEKGRIPDQGQVQSEGVTLSYEIEQTARVVVPRSPLQSLSWQGATGSQEGFFVDVGNPHVILFDVPTERQAKLAPEIRHDRDRFPQGTNVHFLKSVADGWRIRSFERGVEGFTKACGSGILAAANVLGKQHEETLVFFPEGQGSVRVWPRAKCLVMDGPTHWVAEGEWRCC